MARTLGVGYNPVSFYHLYADGGETVQAMIAEVTNTPWGERHCCVIERPGPGAPLGGKMPKRMHVSPFMPMEQTYEWAQGARGAAGRADRQPRARGAGVRGVAGAAPPRADAAATATVAHPPQVLAAVARIYGNGAAEAQGRTVPPHPKAAR